MQDDESVTLRMMRDLSLTAAGKKQLKKYVEEWKEELETKEREFELELGQLRHYISEAEELSNSAPKTRRRRGRKRKPVEEISADASEEENISQED